MGFNREPDHLSLSTTRSTLDNHMDTKMSRDYIRKAYESQVPASLDVGTKLVYYGGGGERKATVVDFDGSHLVVRFDSLTPGAPQEKTKYRMHPTWGVTYVEEK